MNEKIKIERRCEAIQKALDAIAIRHRDDNSFLESQRRNFGSQIEQIERACDDYKYLKTFAKEHPKHYATIRRNGWHAIIRHLWRTRISEELILEREMAEQDRRFEEIILEERNEANRKRIEKDEKQLASFIRTVENMMRVASNKAKRAEARELRIFMDTVEKMMRRRNKKTQVFIKSKHLNDFKQWLKTKGS